MNCAEFERWLDEGRPDADRAAAMAHRDACAECGERLAAHVALEETLRQRFAVAPATFTERVMARLPERAFRHALPTDLEPVLPWWIRALQEPATVLAFVTAALVLGTGAFLGGTARNLVAVTARGLEQAVLRFGAASASEELRMIGAVAALLLTLASPSLWRFFAGLARPEGPRR